MRTVQNMVLDIRKKSYSQCVEGTLRQSKILKFIHLNQLNHNLLDVMMNVHKNNIQVAIQCNKIYFSHTKV